MDVLIIAIHLGKPARFVEEDRQSSRIISLLPVNKYGCAPISKQFKMA